jgi:eukaryotic-like serine/threonine-protein kinase
LRREGFYLSAPSTIGRYEVLSEIGRGAMGIVYEARDPSLGRTVALKVIQPVAQGEELEAYEGRFLEEARIAAALQHPGIVVVHDVGRDPASGSLFIALELLRGETLADLARGGPVSWPVVMRIVAQVAHALDHAHRHGVVHRDIKPANVIVLPSGEAKVMDFGIARLESARQRLTSTGEFIGTPLYTAPEQARVEDVDGRADVFSLASVAYTLLTGRPPFLAPTIPGIVHRVVYDEPEPLSRLVPDLPPDVESVLTRALAKDPEERYPTAGAFAEDAEDLLEGRSPRHAGANELVVVDEPAQSAADSSVPAVAARTATVSPPRRSRPDFPLGRVLVAVLGIGLLASFLWLSRRTPGDAPAAATRPAGAAATVPARPSATTVPAPGPAAREPAPTPASEPEATGRLRIDFDHPLERGTLRIYVDDELALEERLTGQRRKKALVFRMHEGSFREELEIKPGLHEVRVEVLWDDNLRRERTVGNFRPGLTRRLEASLGRIRRDLNLEWK